MPVAKTAIAAFLKKRGPTPIRVKGKSFAQLCDMAEDITGTRPCFKAKPRMCQVEGLVFALWARRCSFFYDPRTGKSPMTLFILEHLKRINQFKRALIIAHAPIGLEEWEGQYRTFCDLNLKFITSSPDAFDRLCDALESDCDAIVIAWPTLQTIFTVSQKVGKRNRLHADLDKLEAVAEFFDAIIIDEIHKAMNDDALRFVIAEELCRHCDWRIGLTGTPFGRDPSKLWAQTYLLDGGEALSPNKAFFEQAFGKKKYNHFSKKDEYPFDNSNLPIVREKIAHMMLACTLDEVQDVNVITGVVSLRMTEKQQMEYDAVVQNVIERGIHDEKSAKNAFVQLRRIASGYTKFIDDDGQTRYVDFFGTSKLVWLEELLVNLEPDLKCIIVHEFIHSGELICRLLEKLKIKHNWLYGKTKDRKTLKSDFQEGDTQVLVANWQTGGTSINLAAADYLCFFESPASAIARQQVEARPMARGARLLILDDLVCAPIERRILSFNAEGKSLVSAIKKDPSILR